MIIALLPIFLLFSGRVFAEQPKAAPVVSAAAKLQSVLEEIPLSGSVYPWRESSLSTQVDGLIVDVRVDDGDAVKKGDLLIRLDDTIANLNTRQAKAALEEADAAYRDALRQRDEAEKLVAKRHVAETAYKTLIAEAEMKAAVRERLAAEHRRAAELAARHRILAPFDGIIGTVSIEIGQWVESGESVLNLFEIDIVKVRVPVPQRYFSTIEAGTPVRIGFDALPGQVFQAAVSRKIPIGDQAARTFPVRIDLPNPQSRVAPGMSAKVQFRIHGPGGSGESRVLTVPRDALITHADGSESVWKIRRSEAGFTVTPVPVRTGRVFDEAVEITEGMIDHGDLVVVRGNEILKPGQRVRLLGGPEE